MSVQLAQTTGAYFQAVSHNRVRKGHAKYALKMHARHEQCIAEGEALKAAFAAGLITKAEYRRLHAVVFARTRGTSAQAVSRRTGLDPTVVRRVYNDPWFYSPIVDRIAIRRALQGDSSVLPSMTVFEREVLYRKFQETHRESMAGAVQLDDDGCPLPSRLAQLERALGLKGLVDTIATSVRRQSDKAQVAA